MINQVIKISFECYVNAENVITDLDHIAEVNEDITNKEDSVNLNLGALNEEMGFDTNITQYYSMF
jgi:hypothetical protein